MKKSLLCLLLSIILLNMPSYVLANNGIEYFEDGSYGITTYEIQVASVLTKGTVSKIKSYTYYDSNDVKQWKVSITGSFSYTGSSATCTSSSTTYTIYDAKWKVTKSQASKSGRTATGEFTVKKYLLGIPTQTVNKTLTLSCSNSGNIT